MQDILFQLAASALWQRGLDVVASLCPLSLINSVEQLVYLGELAPQPCVPELLLVLQLQ